MKNNQKIHYLDTEHIKELNKLAIKLFVQKKGDKHEVLSFSKLRKVIKKCELENGDIIDKAVVLLIEIVKSHAFASGNRRTAILATLVFCRINGHNIYIPDNPTNSKVLIGIREDYYSKNEIKEWIKNGEIRKFQR